MKIIYPNIEYWSEVNVSPIEHIARCARICYRSEKGNDEKLVNSLWNNNHRSMFRHSSKYYILPNYVLTEYGYAKYLYENPYIDYVLRDNEYYISANEQYIREHPEFYNIVGNYEVAATRMFDFAKTFPALYDIIRYTFKVTTQISTSRELNRVSPNNIAEQSTRYVYEDGTICHPHWLEGYNIVSNIYGKHTVYKDGKVDDDINHKVFTYFQSCKSSFDNYKFLIEAGIHRQDARGVLPLDTATVCAYTYTGNEWKHILDLRYRGTTGKPHPNAYIIGEMIHNELQVITKGVVE